MWQDLGGGLGLLLATCFIGFSYQYFSLAVLQSYAWRLPFFAAFLIGIWMIYFRQKLQKIYISHEFKRNQPNCLETYYQDLAKERKNFFYLTLALSPNSVFWYLNMIYIPNHISQQSSFDMLFLSCLI